MCTTSVSKPDSEHLYTWQPLYPQASTMISQASVDGRRVINNIRSLTMILC